MRLVPLALGLLLAATIATGCGECDDSSASCCGEGTILKDEICVALDLSSEAPDLSTMD